MSRLRTDQAGLTLVEMLVSMTLGLIVLTAIMALVQTSQRVTTTNTERSDATQKGRIAMDQMIQGLRSQVCLKADATAPQTTLTAGSDTSVTFFANIATPDAANSGLPSAFNPKLITFTYNNGTITQSTSDTVVVSGAYTFPAVNRVKQVLTGAAQAKDTTVTPAVTAPVFRFYGYLTDGSIDPTPLATPLAAADLPKVAKIDIDYVSKPSDNTSNSAVQVEFEDSVTLRLLFPAPKTAVQNRTVACTI
jgi:prepilin-type N-terminal cleavage/methylation domain-containing protein